jgi:hypothetical protein
VGIEMRFGLFDTYRCEIGRGVFALPLFLLCACEAMQQDSLAAGASPLVEADGGPPPQATPNRAARSAFDAIGAKGPRQPMDPAKVARSREALRSQFRGEANLIVARVVEVTPYIAHLDEGGMSYDLPYVRVRAERVRALRGEAPVDPTFEIQLPVHAHAARVSAGSTYVLALDSQTPDGAWKLAHHRLGDHAAVAVEDDAVASNGLPLADIVAEGAP